MKLQLQCSKRLQNHLNPPPKKGGGQRGTKCLSFMAGTVDKETKGHDPWL